MPRRIISFGFRHGKPQRYEYEGFDITQESWHVIDVREHFNRNPYHNKKLRNLRGTDKEVQADILKTPGFAESYANLRDLVNALDGTVFIGCTGGHHRSVFLAEEIGKELGIEVLHRDINR